MAKEPTVSVALCTYNGSRYIEGQLRSIMDQTYPPEEIVVCDDGSTDGTCDLVEAFGRGYPDRMKLLRNPTNIGRNNNFSQAISLCSGDIIVLSDQDDIFLPRKIEILRNELIVRPNCGLVFSNAAVADSNLNIIGGDLFRTIWPPFTRRRQRLLKQGRVLEVLVRNSPAIGCSIAFRSSLKDYILPIPGEFSHDVWIMAIAGLFSDIGFVHDKLVLYRQHNENLAGVQVGIFNKLKKRMRGDASIYYSEIVHSIKCWEALRDRLVHLRAEYCLDATTSMQAMFWVDGKIKYLNARRLIRHKDIPLPNKMAKAIYLIASRQYRIFGRGPYSLLRDLAAMYLCLRERVLAKISKDAWDS